MKPKLLLRIAAAVMLLHTAGHTIGALTWTQAPNTGVGTVITGMQREQFDFMGRTSTLAQFYSGYGIIMIFVLLLIAVQLWLFSSRPDKVQLTAMALFLSVMGICEYIYFFPLAAAFTLISAICVWLARYGVSNS